MSQVSFLLGADAARSVCLENEVSYSYKIAVPGNLSIDGDTRRGHDFPQRVSHGRREKTEARHARAKGLDGSQRIQARALSKSCCQGARSPQSAGCQECCTVRNTRSGWGMTIVTRPSSLARPAMPWGDPFGLAG